MMTGSHSPDDKNTSSQQDMPNSKVARLIETYDLESTGESLERRWTGDGTEQQSLRDLADWFNQQLLATVMDEAGLQYLDGEVENTYRLLTADDISTGTRTQARRRLERADVDVDELDADFVSRQAVHTYLTAVRGATYTANEGDPVDREATNIRRLKRRLSTITNSKLEQLRAADQLTLGEFNVLLDLRVLCEDCGTQYQLNDLLDARTCECGQAVD